MKNEMNDLAAALLKDVRRWTLQDGVQLLAETEVLAALTAALDPALPERAGEVLEGVTPGRVVQFHPHFCEEAKDASFKEWDTSHDLSVITSDGERYRIGSMRHADDAAFFQWCHANLPAILAQNAALRAERDASNELGRAFEEDAGQQRARAEAAEAQIAALTAQVEGLTGALQAFKDFDDLPVLAKRPDVFELRVRQPILAALSATTEEGK